MIPRVTHTRCPSPARGTTLLLGALLAAGVWALSALPTRAAAQGRAPSASNARVKPSTDKAAASVFAVLTNPTMYDVYFTSASADVAGRVEFREVGAGSPTPQTVKHITVSAYETLELGPRGVHLELLDLKKPLAEGETVALTLTTDQGVTVAVSAVVRQEP